MVRVMGHMSSSGSASRSASGASGRSPRALVERRVRTPELAFPDAGCDTADVLRRFEGAIERTPGVAASPALGTLRNFGSPVSFRKTEGRTDLLIYKSRPISDDFVARIPDHTQPTRELGAVAGRMRETVGAKRIALAPSTNYERQLLEDAFDR